MKSIIICVKIGVICCGTAIGFLSAQSYYAETEKDAFSIKQPFDGDSENVKIEQAEDMKDEFDKDLTCLKNFRVSGTLEELLIKADNIENKWGKSGGQYYGLLIREFLGVLTSQRFSSDDDKALNLSQQYVVKALKKADSFDLEMEWQLLMFLRYPVEEKSLDELKIKQRPELVKLWLHALRRLQNEKDVNFNPDDEPALNVQLPKGVDGIAGMSPSSIQNPKLRTEYEKAIADNKKKAEYYNKQNKIRQNESLIIKNGVKYIARMYSSEPKNLEELVNMLSEYELTPEIREMIKLELNQSI